MRHRSRLITARLAPIGALCALLSLLAACSPLDVLRPAHGNRLSDQRQIFRPLDVGVSDGEPETLDPARIQFAAAYDKAQLIYPMLVTLGDDLRPLPWAARALPEVSTDGLTYTFHLRDHLQWSDGTPITADDFAFSINRSLDPCTHSEVANYLFLLAGAVAFNGRECPQGAATNSETLIGRSIVAADTHTLQLTLEHPAGYFLATLTYPTAYAVPRRLVETYPKDWTAHLTDGGGFGGNLYRLVQWDHPSHRLAFERNERFWGQKPIIRRIEYTLYLDNSALWLSYAQGAGDVGYPPIDQSDAARGLAGSSYYETPTLSIQYLVPNWHIAPFDDVRVRRAFWLAIDRRAIAHYFLYKRAVPTIHMMIQGLPEYNSALADPAGRTGDAALGPDLAGARALGAAYAAEKCGGQFGRCPPIYLVMMRYPYVDDELIRQWQAAFPGWPIAQTGSRCHLTQCPRALPLYLADRGADYPDAQEFLSLPWRTGASYNQSYVSLPDADTLLDQADLGRDPAQRTRLYQTAEQLLVNQVAAIPLTQTQQAYLVRSRVGGGWHVGPLLLTSLPTWQRAYLQD
jgi:oligopeptide transport system substrate-binding protein